MQSEDCENKNKKKKIAIIGFIVWLILMPLSLALATLQSVYLVIFLLVFPLLYDEIYYRIQIKRGKSIEPYRKKIMRVTLIISLIVSPFFIIWSMDAPPIENDYTVVDLRSAPAEFNRSFDVLLKLHAEDRYSKDAPAIGLTVEDVNTLDRFNKIICKYDRDAASLTLALADEIALAWEHGKKGRDIIEELNSFDQIADLTEIKSMQKSDELLIYNCLKNLRRMMHLYRAHIYLQTEKANTENAIENLATINGLIRKLSVNNRTLMTRLVCIAGVAIELTTANHIANHPLASDGDVARLAEIFPPLTDEQKSMRNAFLYEYLMARESVAELYEELRTKRPGMIKTNSSYRLYRNFIDPLITGAPNERVATLHVWPRLLPNIVHVEFDSDGKVPKIYWFYNLVGSLTSGVLVPAAERVCQINMRVQIHDDLLQIVMNKRLSKPFTLKARAYSDNYIVDVKAGRIFSPSLDGKANTDDDIYLTINPVVIGW
jgi:hypothetical protein